MIASADLLVLGAGPAGLAAAWRAAVQGHSVVVLERAADVGGLAGSFEVAGVRVDHGSHRLHPATPAHLLADLQNLLGDDLQTRQRNGRLRVAGSWVSFPLRPRELLAALPPSMLTRLALDTLGAPLRRQQAQPNFANALRQGLGPTLYREMYAPYAEKLWGLPGERIDADQAAKRVTADTPWKVAARMLRLDRARGSGQGRVFHYPRRGFGQLVEALAEAASAAGADIRLSSPVDALAATDNRVSVRTESGSTLEARHAFSTLPMPILARISSPGPPRDVIADAARLRFRAMVLVYLVHGGGRWTPYDAHYLPGLDTPITRISEPANYRDSADDPADRTVLCAEVPCEVDDEIWTASEPELAQLVADGLQASDLPRVHCVGVEVRRLPHVYPIYEVGYARHLTALDQWVGSLPSVTTFGRLGLFAHDNTHHALAMAYDAVAALDSAGGFDADAWSRARRRFADHVVED